MILLEKYPRIAEYIMKKDIWSTQDVWEVVREFNLGLDKENKYELLFEGTFDECSVYFKENGLSEAIRNEL